MNIITTISPANIQRQQVAINSWIKLGFNIKSVNSKNDIKIIRNNFDIEFIETDNLGLEFGKDYVRLNAITDNISDDTLIINSDIEITDYLEIPIIDKCLTIFNRNDYEENKETSNKYTLGFDAFYITNQLAELIPQSKLVIGQCHWDYFLPIIAIRNGFTIASPHKSNLYHKVHELQYDFNKIKQTSMYFANELSLTGNLSKDNMDSIRLIRNNTKYY